jgi:prevent-host-death family protein
MNVSLQDAETRLSELIDRASAGESICIMRDGKPIAQLTAVVTQPKPFDFAALRELTDRMPMSTQSAADLVRSMRDEGY